MDELVGDGRGGELGGRPWPDEGLELDGFLLGEGFQVVPEGGEEVRLGVAGPHECIEGEVGDGRVWILQERHEEEGEPFQLEFGQEAGRTSGAAHTPPGQHGPAVERGGRRALGGCLRRGTGNRGAGGGARANEGCDHVSPDDAGQDDAVRGASGVVRTEREFRGTVKRASRGRGASRLRGPA